MPRYIDADALVTNLDKALLLARTNEEIYDFKLCKEFVRDAPTISPDEVRGVVHCRECKFWRRPPSCEGLARCETGETGIRYRSKNDFCSRGAKMEVTDDA